MANSYDTWIWLFTNSPLHRMHYSGDKIPRKTKKRLLGNRLNKNKLRKLMTSVEVIRNKYPKPSTILPYEFCPKCGCEETVNTGNMSGYPEHWEHWYCLRCNFLVAVIDNSPRYHVLEYVPNIEDF